MRYWAATGLGILGEAAAAKPLGERLRDSSGAVRVAAALALCRLGEPETAVQTLIDEIDNSNLIVGMYAMRALELSGVDSPEVRKAVEEAKDSPYEFTRRIAKRLSAALGA